MLESEKRSRARRVLGVIFRRSGRVAGVTVTFVAATAAASIIHLDLPATRRLVATQVNGILAGALAGDVRVEHIGGLGLGGIEGVRVRVRDPEGVQVLDVDNVRVRVGAALVARSALFGKGPIVIEVSSASIGNVDANLDTDNTGNLRIANAFSPGAPSAPSPSESPGRGVRLEAPDLRIGHAWAHGTPPDAMFVDGELSELSGRLHLDPAVLRADLDRVRFVTRAMPRGVDPKGTIGGHFRMPAENGQGVDVEATFDGDVGGMPTTAEARMNDKRVDVRIDARDATGVSANAMLREVDLHDALSLHAEAHGDLPTVDANATLVLGHASVKAGAIVTAGTTTRVSATMSARHIDASAIAEGAPRTDLSLDARGDVAFRDGDIQGDGSLESMPGSIEGEVVPCIEVKARADSMRSAQVRARVHEKSMPTEVAVDVSPRSDGKPGQIITAAVRLRAPDVQRVPKLGAIASGSADVEGSGRLTLPEKAIDAEAHVSLVNLKAGTLTVGTTRLMARVKGSIDRPVIDAEVHSRRLLTGTLPFATLDASARIEPAGNVVSIKDVHVEAVRPTEGPIRASARLVRVGGSGLRVDDAEVRGLGEPIHAEVRKEAGEIHGTVDAPSIDLALVASVLQLESHLTRGTLSIQAAGRLRGGEAKGKVHVEAHDVAARDAKGVNAVIDASIDGPEIELDGHADLPNAAKLQVRAERIVIGGHVTDPNAWKRIKGRVRVDSELDMQKVVALLPNGSVPLAELRGILSVQGRLGRDSEEAAPEIMLHAHTNGLVIAGRSGVEPPIAGTEVQSAPRWRASDVDVGLDVRNDGTSGLTNVAFRATDRHGVVVAVDAKTILAYAEIVATPSVLLEQIVDSPMSVKVVVPTRQLSELPAILGVKAVKGAVEADLEVTGTARDPRVHLVARGRGVRSPSMPVDVDADTDFALDYDGKKADLVAKMRSRGREMLDLSAHAEAPVREVLGLSLGGGIPLVWNASGRVHVASFPLETIPQLVDRGVKGRVSGDVSLTALHQEARLKGQLDLARLRVGTADYEKGTIAIDAGAGKLAAKVRLDQKDGYLDASASAGLSWGAALIPTLDKRQPVEAKLDAKSFRAGALQPFLGSEVPVFDGRIDADVTARILPGTPGAAMQGTVVFRRGTVQLAALGEELRDVKASIAFSPDGSIRATEVFAKGAQGVLHANADAKLDGLRLAHATANIEIPHKKAFDLALQGQPVGQLSGRIKVRANQSADAQITTLLVEVPELEVELPKVTKSGLQPLEEKQNIRVGVYRDRTHFVKLPLDKEDTEPQKEKDEHAQASSRLDVDVRLQRVTIVRGNQLRIMLKGNPKVTVGGGETKLVGQIQVEGGWLDVQGKKFDVERGTVTFNGESPPNPVVVVTAGWNAGDGSRIYADFVGPVKTGKVTLRSEPARPKNEILALILFGTADGANPSPSAPGKKADGTTQAAVGLGGGFAAEGLTEALDDLTGIQATARIDSTSANNPRPEVEFQVSRKVSVAFAHVIGTPPITEPDRNLARAEYRFKRNWSLLTTVGDRGTGLVDAIWQKRY